MASSYWHVYHLKSKLERQSEVIIIFESNILKTLALLTYFNRPIFHGRHRLSHVP